MEEMIRAGNRPTLDLYWSPLAPRGGGYVCADDETALAAYSRLSFTWVPCRVLKPKKVQAPEASIWFEKHATGVRLKKAVAPVLDTYTSFIGPEFIPFRDVTRTLINECANTRSAVIVFHKDHGPDVHYHQMLHACLRRHERLLDSISRLVDRERVEHAEALARIAYEGFLNFYIDWLSPEFFGPRLQLLSRVRSAQSHGVRSRDDALATLDNLPDFLENTSEKGHVSPLGSFFHSSIYPSLSLVSHQSYIHLEEEASDFEEHEAPDFTTRVKQLGRWLDVLTAALVVRVRNDIGMSVS